MSDPGLRDFRPRVSWHTPRILPGLRPAVSSRHGFLQRDHDGPEHWVRRCSAFFYDDYDERAGMLKEQVELLALVRDTRISSTQLRAILELSPEARQAIVSLATARDDVRRHRGEHDETG